MIPTGQHSYNTRSLDQTETYYCRTDAFKNSFFPYTIVEWNKLDFDIRKSKSYAIFRNALLKIGRPNQCSIYRIHNPVGLKLLTRLRLGLSHLNEHRFNHNFQSCINPLCSCSLAIESTTHFLLHCHHFSNIGSALLNTVNEVLGSITNISDLSNCALVKILLFGDQNYSQVENAYVINATIREGAEATQPKIVAKNSHTLFFYSNLYLTFLTSCCENIFKIVCIVSGKIGK